MHIILVDSNLHLVKYWIWNLRTAELHTAVGVASCSFVVSRSYIRYMCRGLENREIQHVFRHFRVFCIFITVCAGIFVYWFRECGVPSRSILSSHAACDHLVCVELYGMLNKSEIC